jgi:hypothetical protein
MDQVTLGLFQRENKTLYWELSVRSEVKPRVLKIGIMEFGGNTEKERQQLGVLGGALAEELCEQYNDTLEPSGVARATMEAHKELLAENPHIRMGDEAPRAADKIIAAGRVARH